jgi:hypothetical protein
VRSNDLAELKNIANPTMWSTYARTTVDRANSRRWHGYHDRQRHGRECGACYGYRAMFLIENKRRLRRQAIAAAAFQLLVGAFVLAIVAFIVVPWFHAGGSIGVAALFLAYAIWTLRGYARMRPRVVPYFELKDFRRGDPSRKTAEESGRAFLSGEEIAANLEDLDELALRLGVAPLSSFGFGDDLLKQEPQWSGIDDGLRTLSALLTNASKPDVAAQLQNLAAALAKARQSQVRFCLIVRYGPDDAISGVEMAKRQGTFWCAA